LPSSPCYRPARTIAQSILSLSSRYRPVRATAQSVLPPSPCYRSVHTIVQPILSFGPYYRSEPFEPIAIVSYVKQTVHYLKILKSSNKFTNKPICGFASSTGCGG
ncbi:MAG: hypothetical protein K2G31_04205, partial [Clostridia bacterium]|nr:hypothetical protein [Clostridia bacterium]